MTAPAAVPLDDLLVLLHLPHVRALDRRTGALVWEAEIGGVMNGRVVLAPQGFFVLAADRLVKLDRATGRVLGDAKLPFEPEAVLFDGERFYLSDVPNVAAVDLHGRVVWSWLAEAGTWRGTFRHRDAAGTVLSEGAHVSAPIAAAAGLVLGDRVVQPDFKGKM